MSKPLSKARMKAIEELRKASDSARVIAHACRGARSRVTAVPDPGQIVQDFAAIEQAVLAMRKRIRKAVEALDN